MVLVAVGLLQLQLQLQHAQMGLLLLALLGLLWQLTKELALALGHVVDSVRAVG